MRKKVFISILSLLYSLFCIFGNSFKKTDSFKYIESHKLIVFITFIVLLVFFYLLLSFIFNFIEKKRKNSNRFKKLKDTKLYKLFDKHPFLFSFIIMILLWLPYIIAFYPIILSPDPSFQIKQFFGIPNKYSTYSVMIDPLVTITNHHPVIHTLLLGGCLKLGTIINNDNLGLFFYSMIQITILASVLSYTIKFLKSLGISNKYLIIVLLIYGLVPVFPIYSISAVKDVIFGSLIILYIIALYKIVKSDELKPKFIIKFFILLVLIVLFRNNGIHTILLSLPFLLFLKKGKKIRLKYLCIIILIFGFNYSYNSIILPHFKITPTSVREKLSVPFQQTARYVKEHGDEVSLKEKTVIDKILGYETLASRYNPELADPVKNEYNKYATNEDLKDYFGVWFDEFKKHPKTYVEATINNTYGYFYPLKTSWYYHSRLDTRIVEDGFDYHYNGLKNTRKVLDSIGQAYPYIPILGLLINIAFNVWVILFMFMYFLYKKKYSSNIYLLPSLVLILVCFASPANTYFRYALPFVFALPLNIGIFIKENKLKKD
ncbi:MAG: hypothetical protein IKF36_05685 [Bacilli bacterium]|nr:hypothetical protein [Bacilli bacterium]